MIISVWVADMSYSSLAYLHVLINLFLTLI